MKGHERRACGRLFYYKLARWDAVNQCWNDKSKQYDSATEASEVAAASGKGRYRLSFIQDNKPREDLAPFEIK